MEDRIKSGVNASYSYLSSLYSGGGKIIINYRQYFGQNIRFRVPAFSATGEVER